jgi:hypothetical protein
VFFSLCYRMFRWVLQLAALRLRSGDFKELEIVLLRHELAILRRRPRRPRLTWSDRICLAAASRLLTRTRWQVVGSGTGAVIRRQLLGRSRGFPLRARVEVAVNPFPVPAASHAACGFTALRAPAPLRAKGYGAVRYERRLPRESQ